MKRQSLFIVLVILLTVFMVGVVSAQEATEESPIFSFSLTATALANPDLIATPEPVTSPEATEVTATETAEPEDAEATEATAEPVATEVEVESTEVAAVETTPEATPETTPEATAEADSSTLTIQGDNGAVVDDNTPDPLDVPTLILLIGLGGVGFIGLITYSRDRNKK